jgi:DNA-binding protein HU-beta
MNKKQIIKAIATQTGYTQKASENFINAFLNTLESSLSKGEGVTQVGYGTWSVRKRAARKGINPQTKKEIHIPATKVPVYRAGKALKEAVNKKK